MCQCHGSSEMTITQGWPISQWVWQVKESSLLNGHKCRAWVKMTGYGDGSIWMKTFWAEQKLQKKHKKTINRCIPINNTYSKEFEKIYIKSSITLFLLNSIHIYLDYIRCDIRSTDITVLSLFVNKQQMYVNGNNQSLFI